MKNKTTNKKPYLVGNIDSHCSHEYSVSPEWTRLCIFIFLSLRNFMSHISHGKCLHTWELNSSSLTKDLQMVIWKSYSIVIAHFSRQAIGEYNLVLIKSPVPRLLNNPKIPGTGLLIKYPIYIHLPILLLLFLIWYLRPWILNIAFLPIIERLLCFLLTFISLHISCIRKS